MSRFNIVTLAIIAGLLICSSSRASIIFDDFNTNAGHFSSAPTSITSSQTNVASTSTAGRITSTSEEGSGSMDISYVTSATSPARIRFLSGSANPTNNISFTTSNAVDGNIGFYYKTSTASITMQLIIEDSTNTSPGLCASTAQTVTADGAWHLMEWNLDTTASWGASIASIVAPSAAINTTSTPKSYTIDSIYIQTIPNPGAGATGDIGLDFVAKSDSGSIAALVPEPGCAMLLLLPTAMAMRRRKN